MVLAGTLLAPGCVLEMYDGLDDYPVSQTVFSATAVGVGAPAGVALLPLTAPLAAVADFRCSGGFPVMLAPVGITGGLAGAIVAAPVLLLEAVLRLPFVADEPDRRVPDPVQDGAPTTERAAPCRTPAPRASGPAEGCFHDWPSPRARPEGPARPCPRCAEADRTRSE